MMARQKESELLYWLISQDEEVRILVVEGYTDLRFWSLLAPMSQRHNTLVYSIDHFEVVGAPNSARERAMILASRLLTTRVKDRVLFFLDADADLILGKPCPENVILTDFRDIEAYAYHLEAMRAVLFSFGDDPDTALDLMRSLDLILRPCGILRLFDAIANLHLPFQKTWGEKLRTQIGGVLDRPEVVTRDLLRRLLQNASISLRQLDEVEAQFQQVVVDMAHTRTADLAHGKDLVSAISWRFKVDHQHAESAVLAALAGSHSYIASLPRMATAKEFVLRP